MPVYGDGLIEADGEDSVAQSSAAQQGPPTYVLHPNCAIEEM